MLYLLILLCFLFLYVCYTDSTKRIIPNWVSLVFILAFIAKALIKPDAVSQAQDLSLPFTELSFPVWFTVKDIIIALLVFIVGYILWCFKLWGAGDVKFLTTTCLFFGTASPEFNITSHLLIMAIVGGALSLFFIISNQIVKLIPIAGKYLPAGKPVPYGVAISLSGIYGLYLFSDLWGLL